MSLDLGNDLIARAGGGEAKLFASIGVHSLTDSEAVFLKRDELEKSAAPNAILADGLWPGVTRPPEEPGRGDETASASREPWVDSNGYWVGWLRALFPSRPPVLGYAPEVGDRVVPYDSLELALIEAWVSGGNYALQLEPRFKEALLAGKSDAKAAFSRLGATAAWLKKNVALFRQPTFPQITQLVEPGDVTAELANLMYRRNASPRLAAAARVPDPDPEHILALAAADIAPPAAAMRDRILAHAQAGAILAVSGADRSPWWRVPGLKPVKKEPDREFFALGKGQVVAYNTAIEDVSEFPLDVIDLITHRRRAVRLWNAGSVIPLATAAPAPAGRALLIAVNYGSPIDNEVQARIQGHYAKATLLRPEAPPKELKTAKRGSTTEVYLTEMSRLAVVVFA